jgi:hypothetical protein
MTKPASAIRRAVLLCSWPCPPSCTPSNLARCRSGSLLATDRAVAPT